MNDNRSYVNANRYIESLFSHDDYHLSGWDLADSIREGVSKAIGMELSEFNQKLAEYHISNNYD